MADHVDGPRSIGDPAADITDVFVFTSPENPRRTVVAMNVFPSAGVSALFSNVINHSLVIRPLVVAALGDEAKISSGEPEYRFSSQFGVLERGVEGTRPIQRGTCAMPDGQSLSFVVNDEKGSSTPDGRFKIFAGLRSDPFFLAWLAAVLKTVPNLLQHDNVLSIIIEFDTHEVLGTAKNTLFGLIAETSPIPQPRGLIGHDPPRFDWMGRPEVTNMRLNNPAMNGTDDLRDLWNQQTPFAINETLKPLFRQRLIESLKNWDMRDGKADWTDAALAADANVFLDDFLTFDVSKPITDASHLEIEKSTLNGHTYHTGGGRTVNANVIDILLTWMVKHDNGEPMQGGASHATQPGMASFPYLAPPNAQLQTVVFSVELLAPPDKVWGLIGPFGGTWHPLVAKVAVTGTGIGQLRTIETIDGKQIIERLEDFDAEQNYYRYTNISGIPAADYTGMLDIKPSSAGSSVQWRVTYIADGQPDIIIRTIVSTLLKTGLDSLTKRFGSPT
jgi:Domain of unknown function (DUF4331)/Polyketide cyclase / dehydrase and lipid transport